MNTLPPLRGAILAISALIASAPGLATAAEKPNVIVIVADDAGYSDWGFMDGVNGSNPTPTDIPTPNLDALANRGVKFSRAYVAQSCQPTRAALVTGGYQNRIGNEVVGDNTQGLPASATTIWDRMGSQGYTTGAIGKWHLGSVAGPQGNRPETQGVDEFYGIWHGSRTYNLGNAGLPQTQLLRETIIQPGGGFTDTVVENAHSGEYFTNTMGQYAVDFIANHHADVDPFFLYQSFTAPHTPLQNSPDFNDPRLAALSGTRKTYASMMLTMDKEIGRILDRLEDPDGDGDTSDSIADNTTIMFVNDNGGADQFSSSPNGADNGVLRRGKGSSFEGGIRVPMIIAGAGVDAGVHGTTYNKPVHGVDVLPTAVGIAGGTVGVGDPGIDGVNLLPFINGTDTSNPHEVIVNRHRTQFAVIKGDTKLVWTGGSPANNPATQHQLYNLATDVSETNDISAANPAVVAELHRDLTDHEATFDKQRYAILGQTAEATINTFDHFTFRPDAPAPGGETIIIEGSTGDGDFEAPGTGSGPLQYTSHPNWFHAGGSEGVNFTNTSQMGGSSQSNSRGGMPFQNRTQVNNTGYTIASEGETFDLSYDFGAGGALGNWNGDETMRVFLFTANAAVDGQISVSNITELAADEYAIDRAGDGQWTTRTADAFYTSTAGDIGKEVFLGMVFDDPTGNTLFPRIDVIRLAATGTGSSGPSITDWSDTGGWFEGETSNVETMFNTDAFAGAVLEFPTTDNFSYTSNNDMVRQTGLEFMLNKIVLSGAFTGTADQSATIQGNDVLFTNSLDGVGPQVSVDATNAGGSNYTYDIDLNLVMYDDLTIAGDGDVTVTINGQIRDYFDPRNLTKSGTSTVVLTGVNTHAGATTIEGGSLALTGGASLADTTIIEVQAGATFDVSGTTSGGLTLGPGQTLKGSGSVVGQVTAASGAGVSPGSNFGKLTFSDDLTLNAGSNTEIELGEGVVAGADYDQVVISGDLMVVGAGLTIVLDAGYTPSSGDEFKIFDFTNASGSFSAITLPSLSGALVWDISAVLSTGEIRIMLPGDYNSDGKVDTADFTVWRDSLSQPGGTLPNDSDGGVIGLAQYMTWKANFGLSAAANGAEHASAAPEPGAALLVIIIAATRGCQGLDLWARDVRR